MYKTLIVERTEAVEGSVAIGVHVFWGMTADFSARKERTGRRKQLKEVRFVYVEAAML